MSPAPFPELEWCLRAPHIAEISYSNAMNVAGSGVKDSLIV